MNNARVPYWVWGVLVSVHILALGWALHSAGWAFPDSDRYVQVALNVSRYGELYARPWPSQAPTGQAVQEFTIRPPGYPLLIAGLGGRIAWLLVLQNVASLLTVGSVLDWWAKRAEPTAVQWLMGLGLVLAFPAQVIYANAVMSETVLQVLVLGIFACAVRFQLGGKVKDILAVATLAAGAFLVKPVFYPMAAVVATASGWVAWQRQRVLVALIGLLPMLIAGGYMAWNEHRTGYFHFSSIADINLLHYNAAGVVRQVEGPAAEETWVAGVLRTAGAAPTFAARQHVIQAQAGAVLWAHPVVYARQHLQGMVAMLLDPGRFDISQFLQLPPEPGGGLLARIRSGEGWRAVRQLPLGLLALLGLLLVGNVVRLVLAVRGWLVLGHGTAAERAGRWVALGLIGYVALLTGPLGAARFLVPVWPLLLGLALVGVRSAKIAGVTAEADAATA